MLLLPFVVFLTIFSSAQPLPPCENRPTHLELPPVDTALYCLEQVIEVDDEMAFTALVISSDGTLYATRPLTGELFALDDTDGDFLPDTPRLIADGLTLPNSLVFHDDTLYVAGGSFIHRLRDGQLEIFVDDLPFGGGFWTGGLAIGDDHRLYVGIGANCDVCIPEPNRGIILSYDLDGADRRVVAQGFRQPAGLVWHRDALWAVDSARPGLSPQNHDELNQIIPGSHYGFPYCYGLENGRDTMIEGEFDCQTAQAPMRGFPNPSNPLNITVYQSDTFPQLKDMLLVTLGGSYNAPQLRGYTLVAVPFREDGTPAQYQTLIPYVEEQTNLLYVLATLQFQGRGFFPHHVYGVAVSPEGWIYLSSGGRIFALRPR